MLLMAKVSVSASFATSAEQVWALIGSFDGMADWHPAVERSELGAGGKLRRLGLAGGGEVVDRLVSHDDKKRIYRYFSVESPLPVAECAGAISVRVGDDGTGSIVEWSANFAPAGFSETDSKSVVRSVYEAGMDNLRMIFGE
jgi:hypothetical protein